MDYQEIQLAHVGKLRNSSGGLDMQRGRKDAVRLREGKLMR